MALIVHWTVFLLLLLPLVAAGFERLHYQHFAAYLAGLAALCAVILLAVRLLERRLPTPYDQDKEE